MEVEKSSSGSGSGSGSRSRREKAVMPEGVREAVNDTLLNVEELRSNLDEFLSQLSLASQNPEVPPLQRALSLLTMARATSTLFSLRLRCTGVHPDSHRLKGDLDRISRYQHKLDRCFRLSQDPIQPTTQLNFQAANRFIQHSLPTDLTAQQTRSLRELSKNEAGRVGFNDTNFQRKRKSRYQPPVTVIQDQPTVQASLHEFLPNTASQVFHSKQRTHKKPIVPILIEDSSEEEEEENKELEEDDDDGVEEVELVEEAEDDDEIQYEEDDDEIQYEEEEDEILELQLEEEDDELLDDDKEQVEEEQKQEMKGPPVFIILDSSDED